MKTTHALEDALTKWKTFGPMAQPYLVMRWNHAWHLDAEVSALQASMVSMDTYNLPGMQTRLDKFRKEKFSAQSIQSTVHNNKLDRIKRRIG